MGSKTEVSVSISMSVCKLLVAMMSEDSEEGIFDVV
jgi:hypothetical protein